MAHQPKSRIRIALLVAVTTTLFVASACASGLRTAETTTTAESTTSASTTTTTHSATIPSSIVPPTSSRPPADPIDWDGVRYDYGQVLAVSGDPGAPVIEFDRWSLYFDGGYGDAKTMTTEPLVYANTDMPGQNENPQVRRFQLAPNAEVLGLANVTDICSTFETGAEAPSPRWVPYSIADLAAGVIPGMETPQTALTFDASGLVTRVRVSQSC